MSEIKELYVIEWMGPYKSLDDICNRKDTADCCIYLITGHVGRESNGIKYVGITKRLPEKRFSEKILHLYHEHFCIQLTLCGIYCKFNNIYQIVMKNICKQRQDLSEL